MQQRTDGFEPAVNDDREERLQRGAALVAEARAARERASSAEIAALESEATRQDFLSEAA